MTRIIATALAFFMMLNVSPAFSDFTIPSQVILKIGDTPPGGFDIAGRIFAKHLQKALEKRAGKPVDVVVENVGASAGLVLLKQMVAKEPKDGSVIAAGGIMSRLLISHYDPKALDFDPALVNYVGAMSRNYPLCVALKDFDLESAMQPVRVGYTQKSGTTFLAAKAAALGMSQKTLMIGGFKNLEELPAALERGEIDMYCGLSLDTFRRERREEQLRIVFKLTQDEVPGLANVQSIIPLLKDDAAVVAPLLLSSNNFFHTVYLPAGVDTSVLAFYREVFEEIMRDPTFKADLAKGGIQWFASTGEQMDAYRAKVQAVDPETWKRAKDFISND